jgi:hypothetical protein
VKSSQQLFLKKRWVSGWHLFLLLITALAAVSFSGETKEDPAKSIETTHLVIKDDLGRVRLSLGVMSDGNPELLFKDADGKVRIKSAVERGNMSHLSLFDKKGGVRIQASLLRDDDPYLGLPVRVRFRPRHACPQRSVAVFQRERGQGLWAGIHLEQRPSVHESVSKYN